MAADEEKDLLKGLISATRVRSLSPFTKGRRSLRINRYVLGVIAFFVVLLFGWKARPHMLPAVLTAEAARMHPIEHLVVKHQNEFQKKLQSQSKTLDQAVAEYKRRYKRRPPPMFNAWYDLAQRKGLVMIDEFDMLMESIEPFWGVHPQTLKDRVRMHEGGGASPMTFAKGTIALDDSPARQVRELKAWLDGDINWSRMIDNLEVWVNKQPEATVNVPYKDIKDALKIAATQRSTIDGSSPPLLHGDPYSYGRSRAKTSIWPFVRDSCHPEAPEWVRQEPIADENDEEVTEDPTFISERGLDMDPCMNKDTHQKHGMFLSPQSMYLTKALVPILSTSRPHRFNDILYPSTLYTREKEVEKQASWSEQDVAWEDKRDRVFWNGPAYSGWATAENWHTLHRTRMAIQLDASNDEPVALMSRTSDEQPWTWSTAIQWGDLWRYFTVRLASMPKCPYDMDACDEQERAMGPKTAPPATVLRSKYALDMDGMGHSGMFYWLLQSGCAVMKQTVLQEWHDDWLTPWVHYIPVSVTGSELGETARFLIDEPEGQEIGKRIAAESTVWANKVLRKEDEKLYFLRLLMELERIMSLDRNDMYYK